MDLYNGKVDNSSKVEFIKTFAIIADNYSGRNNYNNIIKLLNIWESHENNLNHYAVLKIINFDGITNSDKDDLNRFLEAFINKNLDENLFEDTIEIKELNKLLNAITLEHSLSKLVYHLSILKSFNNAFSGYEVFGIGENELMEKGMYDYKHNIFPISNLDIDSPDNVKIIEEIQVFINKYPSLFEESEIKNINNIENLKDAIKYLKESENIFFERILINFEEYLDFHSYKGSLNNVYKEFLEFDEEFFKLHFLDKNNPIPKECFELTNTKYSTGAPECGYNEYSATALVLNLNSFIDYKKSKLFL